MVTSSIFDITVTEDCLS